jgi:hypothetical protein
VSTGSSPVIIVIDPQGHASPSSVKLAMRPASLRGKVLGLLDNAKDNSGLLLDAIGNELATASGVSDILKRRKPFSSRPAQFVDDFAAKCDVALSGVGD